MVAAFQGTTKMQIKGTTWAPRALQASCVGGHTSKSRRSRDGSGRLECEQRDAVDPFELLVEAMHNEGKGVSAPVS